MTPEKLGTIFPMTLATSLTDKDGHVNNPVQTLCKPVAFSLVSCSVIFTEFNTKPQNREDLGGYENGLLRMYNQP